MGFDTALGLAPAPTPAMPGAGGAPDQQKAAFDAIMKRLMATAQGGQMQMPQPRVQASPESLKQGQYDMSASQNKTEDIGKALGNMGTFIHNAVAQHKQNQIRDAVAEWDGFDRALTKAQVLAGDPSAPDYKDKVQKMLSEDPYVKANLDPSNPKAVKRLKNMYKALNVDLTDDKENVHRQGLAQMFKQNVAFKKVEEAKKKMLEKAGGAQPIANATPGDAQAAMNSPRPNATPQDQQKAFAEALQGFMSKMDVSKPDLKGMESAARIGAEREKNASDSVQYMQYTKPDGTIGIMAVDKKLKPGEQPTARPVEVDDGKGGKAAAAPVDKRSGPKRLIDEGIALEEKGDHAGAQKKFALANEASIAGKVGSPTLMDMVSRANQGDAQSAKNLRAYVDVQKQLQGAKGAAYAHERAKYNLEQYVNPQTHELETMSALDASRRVANGEHLIKTGSMPMQTIVAVQRMRKDVIPAVANFRKFIKAYDNPKDRAIMASAAKSVGPISPTDPIGWMNTVIQQEELQKGQLSSDGRGLILAQKRLAEAMANSRAALGNTATDQSVALAIGLMPGPNTPDSKFANDGLDQLKFIVSNTLATEVLKDVTAGSIDDETPGDKETVYSTGKVPD